MAQSDKKYKILILMTQLERAGVQKCAMNQSRYFHQHDYDVTLCFFYDKYGLLKDIEDTEPYRIVDLEAKVLGGPRIINGLRTLRALWRLFILLRREKILVVETLSEYSNTLGILTAWLAGVPVRFSSQRNSLISFPTWFHKIDAFMVNSNLSNKMVAVSEQTRIFSVEVEGMKAEKVTVIPNGIQVEKFDSTQWASTELASLRADLGFKKQDLIITTVGRLHPQKGHHYLIKAARDVIMNYPNAYFLLVGEGEHRAEIEAEIRATGYSDHFILLGERPDVAQLLAISDLFVLPSLYEGMPNVVLEAMAARLAVIATDVDGTRELVISGDTGLLIPKGDVPSMVDAIQTLLGDRDYRIRLGKNGHQRALEHFSYQVMCRRYEDLANNLYQRNLELMS